MTFETVLNKSLTANSDLWASTTHVQTIPYSTVGECVKFKLTLAGPTTKPTGVLSMYLGEKGTDAYDFFSTPVQVTVSGQGSFDIPQSGTVVTDEISYTFTGTKDLIIATSFVSSSAKGDIRVSLNNGSGTSYYFKSGNDASTVNKSGYSGAGANPNALGIITKIEVERPEEEPPPEYDIPIVYLRDDTYCADFPAELISSLEATNYNLTNPRQFTRVLHVQIPYCLAGDVIDVDSIFGITTGYSLTEISAGLILTPDSTGTGGIQDVSGDQFNIGGGENPSNGVWITKFPGKNVSSSTHHEFFPLSGKIIVPEGMSGTLYAAVIAYAGGTNFSYHPSGSYITIEPHAGHIQANIKRKQ